MVTNSLTHSTFLFKFNQSIVFTNPNFLTILIILTKVKDQLTPSPVKTILATFIITIKIQIAIAKPEVIQ